MGDAQNPLGVEQQGRVLVATMDDGRANAMTLTMTGALRAVIREAENDPGIGAVVIAGREGRFSGGFDLSVMNGGDQNAIREMIAGGRDLVAAAYGSSVPVVAACTGHAIACGAFVLLGCDDRVGPDADVKIGLNEVAIGMVLPNWGVAIAVERLSRRHLQASVAHATLYNGKGAVEAGFLDAVVAPEAVITTAIERATRLAELDSAAYAGTVRALRGPVLARMTGD